MKNEGGRRRGRRCCACDVTAWMRFFLTLARIHCLDSTQHHMLLQFRRVVWIWVWMDY
jgi:hypothetical protein